MRLQLNLDEKRGSYRGRPTMARQPELFRPGGRRPRGGPRMTLGRYSESATLLRGRGSDDIKCNQRASKMAGWGRWEGALRYPDEYREGRWWSPKWPHAQSSRDSVGWVHERQQQSAARAFSQSPRVEGSPKPPFWPISKAPPG